MRTITCKVVVIAILALTSYAGALAPPALAQGRNCPLLVPKQIIPPHGQDVYDPVTNIVFPDPIDNVDAEVLIRGTVDPKALCAQTQVEYEIVPVDQNFTGAPNFRSTTCKGVCDHNVRFPLVARVSYKWQARVHEWLSCSDSTTKVCETAPHVDEFSDWKEMPAKSFRSWGTWMLAPGVDHAIAEIVLTIGHGLGDESEDNTGSPDGRYTYFEARLDPATGKYAVGWIAPINLDTIFAIEGEFRKVTSSTVACKETIELRDISTMTYKTFSTATLIPNVSNIKEFEVERDLGAFIGPRFGFFDRSGMLTAKFRCEADKIFKYGADFISLKTRELLNQ